MSTKNKLKYVGISVLLSLLVTACNISYQATKKEVIPTPVSYATTTDSNSIAKQKWNEFFKDPLLVQLIDTALKNNQELNIMQREIAVATNEIRSRKGAYLPFVGIGGLAGADKIGRYTSQGASDATNTIIPGKKNPDLLPNFTVAAYANWEIDIWKKLRNARQSAVHTYLATVEGKNFLITNLIAEIANSYYELMALDNQLEILQKNIEIQQNALEIVKLQKLAARVTELAVKKFEAEVLKNQSRLYYIKQQITVTENRINFLVGRYPQTVARNSTQFKDLISDSLNVGIPAQLLRNRPDVMAAEQSLLAAKLDVKVAKACFYPTLMITSYLGTQAINPAYLATLPASTLYSIAGGAFAPLINRNALKANYASANAKQEQAVFNYERKILAGYVEVSNQLATIENLKKSYEFKTKQVEALTQSIEISTGLFKSARADYMEVLMTQRDALEAKFELIETKKLQLNATVNMYKSLGGGWR
jgi:NodT family efflux transporter outer membrane factor (OMF) lipoprotein